MFARTLSAAAALSLAVASPAAAQSAAPLSLTQAPAATRAGADLGQAGDLRGGYSVWIAAAALVGILVFVLVGLGDDNDLPNSP